ncbi:MAG: aldehyde dehydrogenase family protein, partial [Pseudomonadota bacterium]
MDTVRSRTSEVHSDIVREAIVSPVSGEALAEHVDPSSSQLQALVETLSSNRFGEIDIGQRCSALRTLATLLENDAEYLARTITLENGCPSHQAESLQVHSAVALLRSMADLGEDFKFEELRPAARGGQVRVLKHPVGPCLGIVPWNVPLFLACAKLASALIAGCPILLKPSPENTVSMGRFAGHLSKLPLPEGYVRVLIGGRNCGASLVANPLFRKVSFTGSSQAGRSVARACADRLARCTLELGGKSAAILLDDVALDDVRDQLFLAMLQNNGQVCGAQSRLLIPSCRYEELRSALLEMFDHLEVGDPREANTNIGPVVSADAARRIQAMVHRAASEGLTLLNQPSDAERQYATGALVAPRLFEATNSSSELWQEEVFGPVVVMQRYDDVEQAIALANHTHYGLSGSILSTDTERAEAVARRLHTGTIGINSKKILDFAAPFGGWRDSGLGREFGPEGVEEYLEYSSILTN